MSFSFTTPPVNKQEPKVILIPIDPIGRIKRRLEALKRNVASGILTEEDYLRIVQCYREQGYEVDA